MALKTSVFLENEDGTVQGNRLLVVSINFKHTMPKPKGWHCIIDQDITSDGFTMKGSPGNTALPRYEITLHGFDLQGGSASYPPRVCEYGNTDTGDFYFDDTTAINWDNSCSYDW